MAASFLDLLLQASATGSHRDPGPDLALLPLAGRAPSELGSPEEGRRGAGASPVPIVQAAAVPDLPDALVAASATATGSPASLHPAQEASAPAHLSGPPGLSQNDPLSQVVLGSSADAGGGPLGGTASPRICQCPLCRQTLVEQKAAPQPIATTTTTATGVALANSLDLASTFLLHSNPTATKTIYLDFNGNVTTGTSWNNSYNLATITTPAFDFDGNVNLFSNAELLAIQGIWQRVAEDFAPFNVNVTTEDPGTAALSRGDVSGDSRWGVRCVIGGSSYDWFGAGAGGVSYVNVFGNSYYAPSFVFEDQLGNGNEKYTAEAISHEVGHSLGLSHDGSSSADYYSGQGSGATGWAPIMGVGYYQSVSQWSKGEYANANNKEDDLAIITGSSNGFGYRTDQVGNSASTASDLTGSSFSRFGIIETGADSDWYRFSTGSGSVSLTISNACQAWSKNADGSFSETLLAGRSPNLDIQASLYRASDMALIATSNPLDSLSASFNLTLPGGTYLLGIDGVGFGDPASSGYSDYGSLGQYLLSGSIILPGSLVVNAAATLLTSEAGGSASFSVHLSQAPTADVVITLTSNDTSEGVLSTDQLLFNASNWSTDQVVTLSGVDDLLVDGNQSFSVSLLTSSGDSAFQGLPLRTLNASNADNDTAQATLVTASLGNLVNRITYQSAPTVTGKVTASTASDNVYLAIREGTTRIGAKDSTSALDGYQWRFDNLVNASQLLFEGYRTANSEADDFQFLISTNNGNSWTPVLSVANAAETRLTANLASPLNGTALVMVADTGRKARQTSLDTLYVDQLALVGQQTDLRPELSVTTTASQAVESLGRAASFTVVRGGDLSRDLDVGFSLAGTASTGSDYTVIDEAGHSLAGQVRIAAGLASAQVRIQPIADGVAEADETVVLSLVAPGDMLRLGTRSDQVLITDSITGTAAPMAAASTASTTSGVLSGTTANSATALADGVVTRISEVLAGADGSATSQLEQRWNFQGLAGASRFVLKASTSSGGDDSFRFEYQPVGSSKWTSLTTLGSGSSGTSQITLGTSLSGDLTLRVVDTNRSAGAGLIDSIAIDAMAFLANGSPLPF